MYSTPIHVLCPQALITKASIYSQGFGTTLPVLDITSGVGTILPFLAITSGFCTILLVLSITSGVGTVIEYINVIVIE